MFGQQRHPAESFAARRARVLLHVRVGLQVRAQIGPVGERAVAVLARERLLAGVRAYVALQQPRAAESFAADFAYARQRVRADVHLQRAQRVVRLVAILAAKCLGRGDGGDGGGGVAGAFVIRTVVLVMFGQPGHGQVRFRARGALVPVGRSDRFARVEVGAGRGRGGRRRPVAVAGAMLVRRWRQCRRRDG